MTAAIFGAAVGGGAWMVYRHVRLLDTGIIHRAQNVWGRKTREQQSTDLAVTRLTQEAFTTRILATLVLAFIGAIFSIILTSKIPLGLPQFSNLILLVLIPMAAVSQVNRQLKQKAQRARASFSYALSSYLDLVNVLLAGGSGIETALVAAANTGDNWAFTLLRETLERARAHRIPPWVAFEELAKEIGVTDLHRVAGSMQLAGEQGARVRASLGAQADAVRGRQINEIEALAQSATERMGVPTVLLFMGFISLLGYPALDLLVGNM